VSFIFVAIFGLVNSSRFFVENESVHREMFTTFKAEHSKVYDIVEEEVRFGVFQETLKLIDERNALEIARGGEEVHGLTKFADWTQEEFNRLNGIKLPGEQEALLGDILGKSGVEGQSSGIAMSAEEDEPTASRKRQRRLGEDFYSCSTPPKKSVNWIGRLTTSVKNQKQCGSCWAFATVEQIESDLMKDHGVKMELSPAQLVQCDVLDNGCQGGNLPNAFEYTKATGGLSLESAYPYNDDIASGDTVFCRPNVANGVATVVSYSNFNDNITHPGEDTTPGCIEKDMANYLFKEGPIALYVDASTWNTYKGGVMTTCGTSINHGVQAVGLNMEADVPYWIIRNSWGGDWANEGYLYMKYGDDLCRLTYSPMITTTSMANVVDAF
jgi:hypothetical protein